MDPHHPSPPVKDPRLVAELSCGDVIAAIERQAHRMGPRVQRTVFGCLWLAGLRHDGFMPDYDPDNLSPPKAAAS